MRRVKNSRADGISIGELSRQTGVNIETIRYYEKIRIMPRPPRTGGGHRVYGPEERRVLAFVRRARELGFSIADIKVLLTLAKSSRAPCDKVRRIASAHLAEVQAKLADLAKLENILAETVAQCATGLSPVCPVLDVLEPDRPNELITTNR